MMHMTFYWGKKVTLLVDSWKTHTWTGYAFTLFICFLFAIFYQYMEDRRLRFKIISKSSKPSSSINSPLLDSSSRFHLGKSSARVSVAILFGVNSAIGYLLMLSIMSFNGGVFIAVVFGLCVGSFVFRSYNDDDDEVMVLDTPCACS
ncbi:hypothetical protein MKX01_042852 [Papaver californicum]|nr:hypothetical protein MKX01_042852 [Papaver californicum]